MRRTSPVPGSPLRHRALLVLAVCAGFLWTGPLAAAKDSRPVELPLTNGKSLTGVVESGTRDEIVVRVGAEEVRRIPWSRLAPLGYYRAHQALAPATDGAARQKLAELAVDLGLYVEAREEYEKALALGALKKREFDGIVARAEADAVNNGINRARKLADSGDLEGAMATARTLKLHFATAPNAADVNRLVGELVARIQQLDKDAAKEKAELERVTLDTKRNKEILRRKTEALDLVQNGQKKMKEWEARRKQGSVTKTRKLAEEIDGMFQKARIHLGRLRRILPRGHEERREIGIQLNKLDAVQFELRLRTAEFFSEGNVYTPAERWAALASYIDPVHPDLVELRDNLLSSRIRYRASDISNARGRVSGP
jgi:tetratricopeptide (TPR) repeat protein